MQKLAEPTELQREARCRFSRTSPCADDMRSRSRVAVGLSEVQAGEQASSRATAYAAMK
jgi:hypothetical protein